MKVIICTIYTIIDYATPDLSTKEINSTTDTNITSTLQSTSATWIGLSVAIPVILPTILIIITCAAITWNYKRRSAKRELNAECQEYYSVLSRGSEQQQESQFIAHDSAEPYNHIHMSPSTGQTMFTPKLESESINNSIYDLNCTRPHTQHYTDTRVTSKTNTSVATQNFSQLDENSSIGPMYETIDEGVKKKVTRHSQSVAKKRGPSVPPFVQKVVLNSGAEEGAYTAGGKSVTSQECFNDAYYKDMKRFNDEQESHGGTRAAQLALHNARHLYTEVMKKRKGSSTVRNVVSPVQTRTVEALYSEIQKKPKSSVIEDKVEA